MTDNELIETFELVREHSSPLVLPLLLSMERAWRLDLETLALREQVQAMTDAMLDMRVAAMGRNDD